MLVASRIKILTDSVDRAKGALVSTVNGELWELGRPIEEDCELRLLGFDTAEGRQVLKPNQFHNFCMII